MNRSHHSSSPNRARLILALVLASPPVALAQLTCPSAPEAVSRDVKTTTEAQFAALGKLKGMELRNQTEVIANNVLARTPQADKVYVAQMLSSMFCSLLRESKQLSDQEKLREFSRFQERLQTMMLGGEKPPAKPKPAAPKPSSAMEAREQLAKLGIPYTTDSLFVASENGDMAAVQLLLDAGMNPNVQPDRRCNFPLRYAVIREDVRMVEAFLKAGADVNFLGKSSVCGAHHGALAVAAARGRMDLVNRFLAAGANQAQIGEAFVYAASFGHMGIAQRLRGKVSEREYLNRALHGAAARGDVPMIEYVLKNGADLAWTAPPQGDRRAALHVASEQGYPEVVKLLLARGADVNQPGGFMGSSCSPLCRAVIGVGNTVYKAASPQDWVETVRTLLAAGARVDEPFRLRQTQTPFYYVVTGTKAKSLELAAVLQDHGANVDALDGEGFSALMDTAKAGRLETVEFLLKRGANPDLRSRDGRTALDLAKERGDKEIVELLSASARGTSPTKGTSAR